MLSFLLLCQSKSIYGQSKQQTEPFPTYQQIRPAGQKVEIFDYVPQQLNKEVIQQKIIFKLFDYPEGEVIYFLNGKKTTNEDEAKTIIYQNGNKINSIGITEPTTDVKRIITIDFTPKK
ncbi:hypothetical protein GCM10027085_35690 [Spirosoma aerophilum]